LTDEDSAWFQEHTGLHPDLLRALEKEVESPSFRSLLHFFGPLRTYPYSCGIEQEWISKFLSKPRAFGKQDLGLLECLKDIGGSNDTITKLVESVERQSLFVEKMDRQLWIRSPALSGTLHRAIRRYGNFLQLFKFQPQVMFTPTLDIDLVWHTHQCSPARYVATTTLLAGRFINHNDKLDSTILCTGSSQTKYFYRRQFMAEYEYCTCWDCEAVLSASEEQEQNPVLTTELLAQRIFEDVAYYRAVEIARRKGDILLPIRNSNNVIHKRAPHPSERRTPKHIKNRKTRTAIPQQPRHKII
jgi:hypothetical protein